jgi:hypothetical protein
MIPKHPLREEVKVRCAAGLAVVLLLLSSIPLQAQIEYTVRSAEQIEGRSAAGDVEFSSLAGLSS